MYSFAYKPPKSPVGDFRPIGVRWIPYVLSGVALEFGSLFASFVFVLVSLLLSLLLLTTEVNDDNVDAAPAKAVIVFKEADNLFSIFECDINIGPFFVDARSFVSSIIDN